MTGLDEGEDRVRTDVAGTAGDQDAHGRNLTRALPGRPDRRRPLTLTPVAYAVAAPSPRRRRGAGA
ncbi:hypothetical protein NOK12_07500 [Nocardioides sp. OK12]|nr:hypothetical protein NOK12_07500 [Nocardioides sp. OK12]